MLISPKNKQFKRSNYGYKLDWIRFLAPLYIITTTLIMINIV